MRQLILMLPFLVAAPAVAQSAPSPSPAGPPASAGTPAVTAATPLVITPEQEARIVERGKKATQHFMRFEADSLVAMISPEVVGRMGGKEAVEELLEQIQLMGGKPTGIVEQKLTRRNGRPQLWTEIKFELMGDETVVTRWLFDAEGRITGAGVNPKSQAPAPDPR